MKRKAFTLLRDVEQSWWYRGRALAVSALLSRSKVHRGGRSLDYGAGFGGMQTTLAGIGSSVDAFEPDEEAKRIARARGYAVIYEQPESIADGAYDLIGAFDVVEHIRDDRAFLERIKRALAPGGRLVISVPAYQFLWSAHDETHGHFRRYTLHSLQSVLVESGFVIERASYWSFLPFLAAVPLRLLGKSGEGGLHLPAALNALLVVVMRIEAALMRIVRLPWGLGLVVVARPVEEESGRALSLPLLVRYLISGLAGGAIQTVFLYMWVDILGWESTFLTGVVVGFLIALVAVFLLQKYWTFRDRSHEGSRRQFAWYTAVALCNLWLTTYLMQVAKAFVESQHGDFFHIWYLLAQVAIIGVVAGASFAANYLITFRPRRSP